jgi:hypothetical protein
MLGVDKTLARLQVDALGEPRAAGRQRLFEALRLSGGNVRFYEL